MNNLKRVLSLALSTIMLVGMMAVGASAADFTDADKIEHEDAVNTLVALNIINGQDDGSFNPTGDVTRGQMAKMIAVAMNGGTDTNTGVKGTATFTDIKGHWAESYIEYCADLGIINGRGDGTFDPDGKVTTIEAAKMVLTALGYDAKAYELTGAKWATQTDQLARKASPALYEELPMGLVLNTNASRDTAAQLIWNGLQNKTVRINPDESRSDGTITWGYTTTGNPTMLKERYGADIFIGTFQGNYNSLSSGAVAKGEIQVYGRIEDLDSNPTRTARFPSDLDISNIGEQVKVIYKDGKNGRGGEPDVKDTIYGVFNTGKTTVYHITKADIQDVEASKIKFGDVKYDFVVDSGDNLIVTNYGAAAAVDLNQTNLNALAKTSGDTIKLIARDDGKIVMAYVVESDLAKVTSVTSSKITLSGVGAIDIESNDVYEDVKKDDVVVYTKLYKSAVADATFVVEKAETVEGEITRYMADNQTGTLTKNPSKLYVDGEAYTVDETTLSSGEFVTNLTDDAIAKPEDEVGSEVVLYMVNGMVGAVKKVSNTEYKYALVLDTNDDATAGLKVGKVQLLLGDNTKVIYNVNKDSEVQADEVTEGDLVKFSVNSSNEVKINDADKRSGATNSITTYWNADTKVVTATDGTSNTISGVASNDCVMFMKIDGSSYKAYNVRNLRTYKATDTSTRSEVNSAAFKNTSGQIVAVYVEGGNVPGGGSNTIVYGAVVSQNGVAKENGDYYSSFDVLTSDDEEPITIYVAGQDAKFFSKGQMIKFDRTRDNKYEKVDFASSSLAQNGTTILDVAVKNFDDKDMIISYYLGVTQSDSIWVGGDVNTKSVDDKVKVIYFDANDKKAGDNIGINEFNSGTGYANAKLVCDSDGVVVAIFVETSTKKSIDGTTNPASAFIAGSVTASAATDAALLANNSATISGDATLDATLTELTAGRTLIVNGDLTFGAAQTVEGELIVNGDLALGTFDLTIDEGGSVTVTGDISGTGDIIVTDGDLVAGDVPAALTVTEGSATVEDVTGAVSVATAGELVAKALADDLTLAGNAKATVTSLDFTKTITTAATTELTITGQVGATAATFADTQEGTTILKGGVGTGGLTLDAKSVVVIDGTAVDATKITGAAGAKITFKVAPTAVAANDAAGAFYGVAGKTAYQAKEDVQLNTVYVYTVAASITGTPDQPGWLAQA